MTHASTFLRTLDERGFVHQITDAAALDAAAPQAGPVTAYVGYDCTAPSLHVGNLVSIMMLRHLQQTGHKPIVLMGGGTTKVGDPSGKDEGRQLLDDARIAANMASIRRIFERFLSFDGPNAAVMVNNADWLDGLAYIPFLRDIGRHFSVNRMLTFDSVKLRLDREQPLSFLEFNYMILQAYDFLELSRRAGCSLQMGGSDQWGNIVNGTDLIRRVDGKAAFGLTTPLITTADGAKMGKTAAGAVWLHEDMLPTYDYWQFWRNTHDADVGRFLRLFTDLPLEEIAAARGAARRGDQRRQGRARRCRDRAVPGRRSGGGGTGDGGGDLRRGDRRRPAAAAGGGAGPRPRRAGRARLRRVEGRGAAADARRRRPRRRGRRQR